MGRRIVILMAEGRVRKARGGKLELLNGKSKARDGDLSCLVCNSERVCPLACVMWAGCPSSEGGSVTEHGNLSIILVSLIPQREPALTTNLYTCLFFFFFLPLHVPCRTVSTDLFVFQNFALLKLKFHLYNLLLLFGLGMLSVLQFISIPFRFIFFLIPFILVYVKLNILPLYCCTCDLYLQNK